MAIWDGLYHGRSRQPVSMMDHLGFISVNRREVIGTVKHVTQHYVSVVSE